MIMKHRLRRVLTFGIAVMAIAAVVAGPAVVSASALVPGDYDNTVNTTVNNQTTGTYRDVIWWGKADPYEQDYINANLNLIATAGSPSRAVVGGDDYAINFTGQRSGGGLQRPELDHSLRHDTRIRRHNEYASISPCPAASRSTRTCCSPHPDTILPAESWRCTTKTPWTDWHWLHSTVVATITIMPG